MKIEQLYTGCLSHAAYYVESNGEVAIFDPLREVEPYIEKAKENGAIIKYIFETHFHADFVSGHLDLAKKTGAKIVYGPTAKPNFDAVIATDGESFELGKCKIKAIHTPGHTMESTTYLLIDENGKEHGIITGDTLFIGDVGRPDLAQHVVAELTEEILAGHLYDSLRNKIMTLSDDLIVYPNHGAGSACGKNMSKETTDILGHQKKINYALNPNLTKEAFIKDVLSGLTAPPAYFPSNVLMNIKGYESLDEVMLKGYKPLSIEEFEVLQHEENALILDTRNATDFAKGFIPNSINIGLEGSFAQWVGEIIADIKQKIILITDTGKEKEAITRLSRIGYDGSIGFLNGGFKTWENGHKPIEFINRISIDEFEEKYKKNKLVIDIRKKSEYDSEHLVNAKNIPLNTLQKNISEFPKDENFILQCGGGYRSMIAASLLKQKGWTNFDELEGGFDAIRNTSLPKTTYVCPTSLL
jgi:glyoxylase-like metal-dependent hydrolase (beta-lactamase superfamily II)/rhodanese-related sulfurtransferase